MSERTIAALILAPTPEHERVVTGLRLGPRARRVAERAGIPPERVFVARTPAELDRAAASLHDSPLLLVRATGQVVAPPLLEPLRLEEPGTRVAIDPGRGGEYAGALRAEPDRAAEVLDALRQDFADGDRSLAERWPHANRVEIGPRARHAAATPDEARAADAWQWQLNVLQKPLDGFFTRRFWRPLARPFTRLFLRLPLSPNQISILAMLGGVAGCIIGAGPTYWDHLLGMAILFVSAVGDNIDGEVARLRLQTSKLGAFLDEIGDDTARVATLLAVGWHVAARHPDLPVRAVTLGTLGATLATLALIYWYCARVAGSPNNQEYTRVLGAGPGVDGPDGRRSLRRTLGDVAAHAARREFIDLFVFATAVLDLPELSLVGLVAGAAAALALVAATHLRLRRERQAVETRR
ncbi:MAG: CDP-alcohol phosphatidyltransferase family protein [Deltaproteobacteria bacterium]|nr:CDP-alcohol phosphatidyltransferase family protein [Deltaproteobacteria bacterium]